MDIGHPARAATGRLVLDTFRSAADPMLAAWLYFREQMLVDYEIPAAPEIVREPAAPRRPTGVFGVWRLLAPNNREIGRCAALLPTPLAARDAAVEVSSDADALIAFPVRGRQALSHGWVLRAGEQPIVMSPRWYESASEAASAARTARSLLGPALLVDGVNIGTESGRRHRLALASFTSLDLESVTS